MGGDAVLGCEDESVSIQFDCVGEDFILRNLTDSDKDAGNFEFEFFSGFLAVQDQALDNSISDNLPDSCA